ncbi:MAG: hypothetical protein AAGA44_18025, partial [Pseudomonadota bacterium]
ARPFLTFREESTMAIAARRSILIYWMVLAGAANADEHVTPSVLEFGMDDTLFVGDSVAGVIYAYDLPNTGRARKTDEAYNLLDVDGLISGALAAEPGTIRYNDLAVHPVTRDAYVSVRFRRDGADVFTIVSVSREGGVNELDLSDVPTSQHRLRDKADEDVSFWRDIPAPTLTVTDLDYVNGEIFVSGISTGEFASTLRRIPYPFVESASVSSIEMYHAAHAQTETRAPIRAMTVIDLDGSPTVVAAYTCTPLVALPVESLLDDTQVTGKTIAELGYGNTPVEVIAFSAADMEGNVGSYVLVVNREMAADLITFDALSQAVASDGLSTPVPYLGATAGVTTTTLPLSGVVQAADQDTQFLLTLRRNLDSGSMEMVSFRKGAFFRLSNFISEYNFPDYEYAEDQFAQGTRMFQNLLKKDEGFPDQAR